MRILFLGDVVGIAGRSKILSNLKAEIDNENLVSLNMGQPNFDWEKIPLSKEMDNKNLKIKITNLDGKDTFGGFTLSLGNPHIVFFVEDLKKFDIKEIGPKMENHFYFPEKCNVTLASIKNKKHLVVNVWERGAGLTKACGTAACATAVAGAILNLSERCVDIEFSQGLLNINWKNDNNIYMKGGVSEIEIIKVNINGIINTIFFILYTFRIPKNPDRTIIITPIHIKLTRGFW